MSRVDRPADGLPGGSAPQAVLEELDGTLIRPPEPPRSVPWRHGVAAAVALTAGRPRLWALALVAFLARGGVIMMALPIVVLPTFIGLSNLVGPASVSAEGPGPRLVALVALGSAATLVMALAGTLAAAAAEAELHRQSVAPGPGDPWRGSACEGLRQLPDNLHVAGRVRGTARIAAIRLALLVPVVFAVLLAVPGWVTTAYQELTLPSDVAAPLLVRILAGAPAGTVLVLVAWLAGEVVGGFATRRAVLLGAPALRALGSAVVDPLRSIVGTTLTVGAALAVSVVALAPAMWAMAASWDAARLALVDGAGTPAVLATAFLLVLAWAAALYLAAAAAAWRASLATAELMRRRPWSAAGARRTGVDLAQGARHAAASPPAG